nr:MAG TPA: hypothetical protein [Caudoviricetes sp.]
MSEFDKNKTRCESGFILFRLEFFFQIPYIRLAFKILFQWH